MTQTTRMKLADLVLERPEVALRYVDLSYVRVLVEAIESGADLPPIAATSDGHVVDGNHRLRAWREVVRRRCLQEGKTEPETEAEIARTEIAVEIMKGTDRELFEMGLERNLSHGLPLAVHDKERVFKRVYARYYANAKQKDLSRRFGVNPKTISRWVAEITGGRHVVRPPTMTRMSLEAPRPATRIPVGVSSSPPSPVMETSSWHEPSLTERTFAYLRQACVFARDDEVTEEGLARMFELLTDSEKSLLLTSLREGFTKIVDGFALVYKRLRHRPPWERGVYQARA